jgi:hypothetical protein
MDARYKAFGPFRGAVTARRAIMALEADEVTSVAALRQREWRARRRRQLRQFCAHCSGIFTPIRRDQAFCGSACRQKGYRRRKASGEEASSRPREAPWRVFSSPGLVDTRTAPAAAQRPAERAWDIAQREAERAREATRKAIDLAHALIG